jgi:hypothetical protein
MAQSDYIPVKGPIMKTCSTLLLVAALAAGSVYAADSKASNVTVSFNEPEKFTDAGSRYNSGPDQGYLDELAQHVKNEAASQLAPGQKLEVTFTDIDLAGEFNPANSRAMDVRIIKDIYLPRLTLSFKLRDADGKVIKEGERKLTDLNFMNGLGVVGRNQPLYYDKGLLTNWVKKEFKN